MIPRILARWKSRCAVTVAHGTCRDGDSEHSDLPLSTLELPSKGGHSGPPNGIATNPRLQQSLMSSKYCAPKYGELSDHSPHLTCSSHYSLSSFQWKEIRCCGRMYLSLLVSAGAHGNDNFTMDVPYSSVPSLHSSMQPQLPCMSFCVIYSIS